MKSYPCGRLVDSRDIRTDTLIKMIPCDVNYPDFTISHIYVYVQICQRYLYSTLYSYIYMYIYIFEFYFESFYEIDSRELGERNIKK